MPSRINKKAAHDEKRVQQTTHGSSPWDPPTPLISTSVDDEKDEEEEEEELGPPKRRSFCPFCLLLPLPFRPNPIPAHGELSSPPPACSRPAVCRLEVRLDSSIGGKTPPLFALPRFLRSAAVSLSQS